MSKPNNTNTTQPSYIPPSPDPRFVETPEFYPPCERCSKLELVCGQSTKAAGKGKADKCERCRVKKTGETSVYPYTLTNRHPKAPNDKELIELEQETAAPWVTGKKRLNQTQVLQIYPYIALDSPCCRPPTGTSKRIRLIVGSTPDTEEDVNTGRRYENTLENLGGGFLRNNVEERISKKRRSAGIDEGFVVAEKEVRLDANEVPEGKDRLFNWSSDDEEEIDVLRKSKKNEVEGDIHRRRNSEGGCEAYEDDTKGIKRGSENS
ncbi:hypothetical protein PSHT_06433 [Puccinia striiformis]|uniref:Uncharacterized protein n=1 Tax=Puccinia striiformis TaxID=27350 RepID=A0A2S4W6P3_9BASI|nr:hypothetical protein PSHT_06433 [Puccinia striiformis]